MSTPVKSFLRLLITVFVVVFSGCSTNKPAPNSALRLYVFNCGNIEVLDISVFQPGIDRVNTKL